MRTTRLTTDDTRPEVTKRLPELDGIRGCAILLVLVWHYVQNQLHPEVGTLLAYFRQAIGFTWSGVDLFFVLSGFLIAGILIDQRGSPHYFRAFYIRRVCRIFPLYYINIGIFLAFLAWQSDLDQVFAPLFGGSEVPLWSYFSFTQNIFMGANNSAGAGWLAVTWSLAVEEQFYLLLPFIVWIVPRNRLPLVFLWVAGTAIFLRSSMPGLSAYINTPWRADALMSGALLAWLVRVPAFLPVATRYRMPIAAVLLVAVAGLLVANYHGMLRLGGTFTHFSLALVYSMLILSALVNRGGLLSRLLCNRVLIWLGGISYGVYLIHTWVSRLVHGLVRDASPQMISWQDAATTLLALAVTLLVAHFSYRWMESRFIGLGHTARYRDVDTPVLTARQSGL